MMKFNKKQSGFSLLEVLVSVVILSIGLLGMAGIQLKGLSSNNSANLRTQATLLANDLAERMHANPRAASNPDGAAANTNYVNIDFNAVDCTADPEPYCSNTSDGPADSCTATEMAVFDRTLWMCGLSQYDGVFDTLPAGAAANVSCTDSTAGDGDACSPGSAVQINITWPSISEKDADGNPITKIVSMITVP